MKLILSLHTHRANVSGLFPVCILVSDHSSRKYHRIGKEMSREDFARMKKGIRLNEGLTQMYTFCTQALANFESVHIKREEERLAPIDLKNLDVLDKMAKRIEGLKAAGKKFKTHQTALSSLTRYCTFKSYNILKPALINHAFLDGWQLHINKSPTTHGMYLAELRTICNALDLQPYPFKKYVMPKGLGRKIALDNQEILNLWEYEGKEKTRHYLDYWFLQYFMNGMNLTDMFSLRWKDYKNGEINFTRKKTARKSPVLITVIVMPEIVELLGRLSVPGKATDYILPPFLDCPDPTTHEDKVGLMGELIRKYLRVAALEVGITKHMITYVARHSFATVMLRAGAPLAHISKSLGHKSLQTTQAYLGDLDKSVAIEFSTKLMPGRKAPLEAQLPTE